MNLILNDVKKKYDVEVLKGVSIEINGYSSIAIIGPSGAGKSTLLRLISGLENNDFGTITMNGNAPTDKEYKKKIGFVFQSHNLFPHLTLEKNISLVLEKTRNYNKEEAQKMALETLSKLKLSDQAHKLPKNVSGGQAQRAAIARTLALKPEIIMLDEPTSNLDPVLTNEVLEAVRELKNIDKDFLLVTHVISFVKDFADYFIYMEKGVVVEYGPISNLNNAKSKELMQFMKMVK